MLGEVKPKKLGSPFHWEAALLGQAGGVGGVWQVSSSQEVSGRASGMMQTPREELPCGTLSLLIPITARARQC